MIPKTQSSCFGEVRNYHYSNRLCSDYTLKHIHAQRFGSINWNKVRLLYYLLRNRIKCVPRIKLRKKRTASCLWMCVKYLPELPIIKSCKCFGIRLVRAPSHTHFDSALKRLNSPGRKTDFNHIHGPPSDPLGNRVTNVFIHRILAYLNRSAGGLSRMSASRKASIEVTYMHVPIRTIPRCLYPPGKEITFNCMNGSPGDPPVNRMHQFKPKRITPFIHRLVSDPIGKEAGWETNIGDTKHVNKHIN